MKQRLQNIGGDCVVDSKPGEGTTVHLRLTVQSPVASN
jgi:signal transduction histidine kinase